MNSIRRGPPLRGRGAQENVDHRFTHVSIEADLATAEDDARYNTEDETESKRAPDTQVTPIRARSIISRNNSPDVGFNLSINPYQGCEHGCIYCFARPSHAYLDLSPGLDFETRIFAKTNAAELLRKELSAPSYRCEPIALGINTDAYQPAERELRITRQLLETCLEFRQPVSLLTKSRLILRDLDLITALAGLNLVRVAVSVTTLDNETKRRLEPRTAGPAARLHVIEQMAAAGIPPGVMVAPVIPRITDHEIEHILEAVAARGAHSAGYVLLRLPHEVEPLFRDWLQLHYPDRAAAVVHAMESCYGGKTYRSTYHMRMKGQGIIAGMIAQRFRVARKRLRLDRETGALDTSAFRPPPGPQLGLF